MIRLSFVMSVHEGFEEEYEKRHNPVWPEMHEMLVSHGVHNYSIFLHAQTRQLFAYAEIEDRTRWDSIPAEAICQKWWAHMKDIMPSNPDNSPVAVEIQEVFHID